MRRWRHGDVALFGLRRPHQGPHGARPLVEAGLSYEVGVGRRHARLRERRHGPFALLGLLRPPQAPRRPPPHPIDDVWPAAAQRGDERQRQRLALLGIVQPLPASRRASPRDQTAVPAAGGIPAAEREGHAAAAECPHVIVTAARASVRRLHWAAEPYPRGLMDYPAQGLLSLSCFKRPPSYDYRRPAGPARRVLSACASSG
mmetsp:Transcript_61932/g.179610  ORF Transcript_61932/g.179610 Transcript_61932/m.179610 type:complete len:202 (+) Transcript_61932:1342-1947(+)